MSLADLRRDIDDLDAELVRLIAARFRLTDEVGILKACGGLPPEDRVRERHMLDRYRLLARDHHIDDEVVSDIVQRIVREVKGRHERARDAGR